LPPRFTFFLIGASVFGSGVLFDREPSSLETGGGISFS